MPMAASPEPARARPPVFLLALNALLAAAVLALWSFDPEATIEQVAEPPGRVPTATIAAPKILVRQPVDAAALTETLSRPLFRADRRPFRPATPGASAAPAEVSKVAASAPQPDFQLVGLLTRSGGYGRALVRSKSAPRGEWVSVGDDVGGWRVASIGPASIEIENGAWREVVPIERPRGFENAETRSDTAGDRR